MDGPAREQVPWAGVLVLIAAACLRLSFLWPGYWQQPWTPHHFDEHILSYEAMALWEGVTPREVGWPASTTRLVLSAAYGAQLVAECGREALAAADPAAAMSVVARWTGERVSNLESVYPTGRLVSAVIGVLHVAASMAAARAWFGGGTAVWAGVLTAMSPLAVSHSQLVLADVTGALFTSWLLALLPGLAAGRVRPATAGILVGLAAASKFHFGVWLLVAIAAAWQSQRDQTTRMRLTAMTTVAGSCALTVVALVPWLWIDPVLGLKEVVGVVLIKAGEGRAFLEAIAVAGNLLWALGAATLAGAIVGVRAFLRLRNPVAIVTLVVLAFALAALSLSTTVFDRYALVLLPGTALVSAEGWASLWRAAGRGVRWAVAASVLFAGLPQAIAALDDVRAINSYHLAHAWIAVHLPDRASVVIHSEDNQYLPRHREQLAECAAFAATPEAYRQKWATNGVVMQDASAMPMQRAIVNDELFQAHWCRRELLALRTPAFFVRRFHSAPRFQTLDMPALERQFREGMSDPARGFDAVLVHWDAFPDIEPAMTFHAGAGPTLRLYLRPALALR